MQISPILINEIDINDIVVSSKHPFCKQDFTYFIDYKDDKKIKFLCIFLSKMRTYGSFDKQIVYIL